MYSREEMLLEIYAMPVQIPCISKWLLSPSSLFFFYRDNRIDRIAFKTVKVSILIKIETIQIKSD